MTTRIADDYEYIKSRMEEIAKERGVGRTEEPVPTARAEAFPYHTLDWSIYAPVNMTRLGEILAQPLAPSQINDAVRDYMAACSAAS